MTTFRNHQATAEINLSIDEITATTTSTDNNCKIYCFYSPYFYFPDRKSSKGIPIRVLQKISIVFYIFREVFKLAIFK